MTVKVSIVAALMEVEILRVVFSYSCPLTLGSVGTPFLPVLSPVLVLFQTLLLHAKYLVLVNEHHSDFEQVPASVVWASMGGKMSGALGDGVNRLTEVGSLKKVRSLYTMSSLGGI